MINNAFAIMGMSGEYHGAGTAKVLGSSTAVFVGPLLKTQSNRWFRCAKRKVVLESDFFGSMKLILRRWKFLKFTEDMCKRIFEKFWNFFEILRFFPIKVRKWYWFPGCQYNFRILTEKSFTVNIKIKLRRNIWWKYEHLLKKLYICNILKYSIKFSYLRHPIRCKLNKN